MKFGNFSNKKFLFVFTYTLSTVLVVISIFSILSNNKNVTIVPACLLEKKSDDEASVDVGNFDSNSINADLTKYFNELFLTRNKSFITGNVEALYKYYDISQTYSGYSLIHEFKRIAYLRDWANERGIVFSMITSSSRVSNIESSGNDYTADVSEEYRYEYYYKDNPEIKNDFGITLYHSVDLQKTDNSYIVIKDYYLDCFQKGLEPYNFRLIEKNIPLTKPKTYNINFRRDITPIDTENTYNRESAVNYANKYCGVSWANESIQSNNYYSYISSCGNCTNFISQCLSDKNEGGGLSQDKMWRYASNNNSTPVVTEAWVSPQKLNSYIVESERAVVLASGSFKALYNSEYFNSSNFLSLQKGDIISYKDNNFVEHNGIITGFDSNGYPLVNSNSINKYKVPFDLGWDNSETSFDLISITK